VVSSPLKINHLQNRNTLLIARFGPETALFVRLLRSLVAPGWAGAGGCVVVSLA
jgi:hypothetical protein